MAIQLRRGAYENYDASKLKPAEVGVVQSGDPNTTDGKAVYIAINANDVKRIPTADEMVDHNAEAEGIYENIVAQNQTASQLFQNTSTKAAEAEQSASTASSASASANSSMQRAETAADLLTNVTATAQTLETGQQATASYSNGVFSFGLPKGDTGNTGAKGDKGDTGTTPNLSIGTVTTLEPGSDATAEITGPAEAPALNIGIPRGNTGEVSAEEFYAAFATDTATGAIAHFTDGADDIPMKDVLVHIEPVQEGSGDPSPDNVRPITGWIGAKVTRTGKNLLPSYAIGQQKTQNGITGTANTDGSITYVGTSTGVFWGLGNSPSILVKAGTYTLSARNNTDIAINIVNADTGTFIEGIIGNNSKTITFSNDTKIYYYTKIESGKTVDTTATYQLELGSTATDYEPYSGQTYDITFPTEAGTVYGGTLDVTKGELVVDRAIWTGNTADMDNSEDYPGWRNTGVKDIVGSLVNKGIYNAISNVSPAITSGQYAIGVNTTSSSNTGVLYLSKNYFNKNQPEWKALALDVQIVLPLATPVTYTLTPQEITSLLGENNVWADTGDSEVEYRTDAKLYITKKITEAVSALS